MNAVYSSEQLREALLEAVYTPMMITLFADVLSLRIVSQTDWK